MFLCEICENLDFLYPKQSSICRMHSQMQVVSSRSSRGGPMLIF